MFKRIDPLLLIPIAFVVVGVASWMLFRDVSFFSIPVVRPPVCATATASTGECVPQRLLDKLPPHPGRSGEDTLAGVDADGDGVRDDVQRFIVENYGYSERGVRALNNLARSYQVEILTADSASREQVHNLSEQISKDASCLIRSVDKQELTFENVTNSVRKRMMNTPERRARHYKFQGLFTGGRMYDGSVEEACGYDPAKLPN
jgi:hypothetical protein